MNTEGNTEPLPQANVIDFNTLATSNETKEEVKSEKIKAPKKKVRKKLPRTEFTEEELNNDLAEKLNLERLSNPSTNESSQ